MTRIAPLRAEDHDAWLPLWHAYLDFYRTTIPDETIERTFARLVDPAGPMRGALAYDDAGNAVGLVHWLTHPATWTLREYCYLEDLFVASAGRGKGSGRALIEHVAQWSRDQGCAKVYWLTQHDNTTARALYDRVARESGYVQYVVEFSAAEGA